MKKTISVIGLGNRGTEYMGFIKGLHSAKAKIVAVCDISQQALDDISPKFGIPKDMQFISTADFFAKGVISDAVFITTQDASHYEITKDALLTGYKYILLEKPVSGFEAEYKELRDLAEEKGALLIVCRSLPIGENNVLIADNTRYFSPVVTDRKVSDINVVVRIVVYPLGAVVRAAVSVEQEQGLPLTALLVIDVDIIYSYFHFVYLAS